MSKSKDKPAATNTKILQVTVTAVRTKAVCGVVYPQLAQGASERRICSRP